jgi:hypothetical protein
VRGRSRTIKPELYDDERLADLELKTGLPLFRIFTGLWCFADREGRFEWSPRSLRGKIHPCWDGDFGAALESLASASYIIRYTVNGKDYGYVRTFKEHQPIHPREPRSLLPGPSEHARQPFPGKSGIVPGGSADIHECLDVEALVEAEVEVEVEVDRTRAKAARPRAGTGATAFHRERRVALPEPDQTDPPSYTRIPATWKPSEALYGEASLAGVPREALDEDVTYWRSRKLGGEVLDIDQFFRSHFARLRKRHETESFKRAGSAPDDRLREQVSRVEMLRAQEAEEERRAAGGGS